MTQQGLELKIDNYYSLTGKGVGGRVAGPVYNHDATFDGDGPAGLESPNDVGGAFFEDEDIFGSGVDLDHWGVHQWYRWTIFPKDDFPFGATVCDGKYWAGGAKPFGFDDSLNPCQRGWAWSIVNPTATSFPKSNGGSVVISTGAVLDLEDWSGFGCERDLLDTLFYGIKCVEASSPFGVAKITIPQEGAYLTFEYRFSNIGDGDYAALLIDELPIWVMAASSVNEGEYVDSGPIPVSLTGDRELTVALYGVGEPNAEFELHDLRLTIPDGDADEDYAGDRVDNCGAVPNPNQADFDGDGAGDACEVGIQLADANHSERVDGFDLGQLARAFGSECGEPSYDAAVDFDRSLETCMVDGDDLAILSTYFGLFTSGATPCSTPESPTNPEAFVFDHVPLVWLTWTKGLDTDSEKVYLGATPQSMIQICPSVVPITSGCYTPSLDPGTYYWQVVATNECGSTFGPLKHFETTFEYP